MDKEELINRIREHKKNTEQNDGVAKVGGKNYYWIVT